MAERAGADSFWIIEDCFYTSGVTLAAASLARTADLHVGIGIMPVVARNPAMTAMEIATLANLAPGRFTAGIGHGVQAWMRQMGAAAPSPLAAMRDTFTVVRALLAGDEVTYSGAHVEFDRVRLDAPPTVVPSLIAGVQQQRSLALAGEVADGVLLVEGVNPAYIEWALGHVGRHAHDPTFSLTTFTTWCVAKSRRDARAEVAGMVAEHIIERKPSYTALEWFDEVHDRVVTDGAAAVSTMPDDYWLAIGAIGNTDDALAHFEVLRAAGVSSINLHPGPDLAVGHELVEWLADVRPQSMLDAG